MGFVVNYPPVTKVTVDETTNEVVVAAAGPRGPQGDPGVVAATAPLTYDSGTQTVALDESGIEIAPSQVTGTAVVDNDSRLSDARTPTAHASSHESGGGDELTLAQSQVTGLVSDLAGKAPVTDGLQVGFTFWSHGQDGTSTSFQPENEFWFFPSWCPQAGTYSEVRFRLTSGAAAGSTWRIGVYEDNNGTPGDLIGDCGTVDVTT